jgi:hypothetical protein
MSPQIVPIAPPSTNGYHHPIFEAWTDFGSIVHVAGGWFIAKKLSPMQALAVITIWTGWQIAQTQSGESWSRVGGELLEFGLGMLLGQV